MVESGDYTGDAGSSPASVQPVDVEALLRAVRDRVAGPLTEEKVLSYDVYAAIRQLAAERDKWLTAYREDTQTYIVQADELRAEVKRLKGLLITGAADHLQGKKWERWRDNVIAALEGEKDD